MKKYLLLALLPLLAMACNDNGGSEPVLEAALVFDVESVASPESIEIDYSSPDPGCGVPKMYAIYADNTPNELLMKCTNIEKIKLIQAVESNYSTTNGTSSKVSGYIYDSKVSFEQSACTLEVIDDNVLKITLAEMPSSLPLEIGEFDYSTVSFYVADSSNSAKVRDYIQIQRSLYLLPNF